jgi:hypothetical protein
MASAHQEQPHHRVSGFGEAVRGLIALTRVGPPNRRPRPENEPAPLVTGFPLSRSDKI